MTDWKARVRRWSWLDDRYPPTDSSAAGRGGTPRYRWNKPAERPFTVSVVAVRIDITDAVAKAMGSSGGQPPFDHRKVPDHPDDVESTGGQIGCLVLIAVLVGISVVLFMLGVRL